MLVSCGNQPKGTSNDLEMSCRVGVVKEPEALSFEFPLKPIEKEEQKGYFELGYDDGFEDGDHLEKGRSYKMNIPEEWKKEYRQGYFAGYADGRAVADPTNCYFTGKSNTDYFDLSDDLYEGDDDDWSDEEDW